MAIKTAAHNPELPRANSGGHSFSRNFIAGQFRPHPTEVTNKQSKPTEREFELNKIEIQFELSNAESYSSILGMSASGRTRHVARNLAPTSFCYQLFRCRTLMNCSEVCPKVLEPSRAIEQIRPKLVGKLV